MTLTGGFASRLLDDYHLFLLLRVAMLTQAALPDSLGHRPKTGTRALRSGGEATVVGTKGWRLGTYGL